MLRTGTHTHPMTDIRFATASQLCPPAHLWQRWSNALLSNTIICSNGFSWDRADLRQRSDLFHSFLQQSGQLYRLNYTLAFLAGYPDPIREQLQVDFNGWLCVWILSLSFFFTLFILLHASATEKELLGYKRSCRDGNVFPLRALRGLARKQLWFPESAPVVFAARKGVREDLVGVTLVLFHQSNQGIV